MFTNTFIGEKEDDDHDMYLTCDVARKGNDKAVIIVWVGFRASIILSLDKSLTTEIEAYIEKLSKMYEIPRSHIVVDEDGVGGGVVDHLPGCVGFVNNSTPFISKTNYLKQNYANLKSQCYYELAEMVNANKIFISTDDIAEKECIIEELEQIRQKDPDKDGKLAIIGKDKIKENIGRSPDFADCLMMRMYFEVRLRYGSSFGT